jgi:hypothetical protein
MCLQGSAMFGVNPANAYASFGQKLYYFGHWQLATGNT